MRKFFLCLFLFPVFGFSQSSKKTELTKIYTQALTDFIKGANKNGKTFDTLYIGKRKDGEPDDFPEIEFAKTIAKVQIRLITPEEGKITQNAVKTRIYINMIGWVEKEKVEFKFFAFSNGFAHQFNSNLKYIFNVKTKDYELVKSEFKGPPFDK